MLDRASDDIGDAEEIERHQIAFGERCSAAEIPETGIGVGIKGKNTCEKCERLLVQGLVRTNRVIIGHPKELLARRPEKGDKKRADVNLAKVLRENGLGDWKPYVAEKLVRIVELATRVTGLCSAA